MEKLIKIGKFVSPHGVKGQLKVYNYSRNDRFEDLPEIIVDNKTMQIEEVGHVKSMVILKVCGIDSRDAAESLRGKDVFMEEKYVDELDEDEDEVVIYGEFAQNSAIQKYLEENGYEITSSEFVRIPNDLKEVTAEQREALDKLIEKLEEDDDVQNVFHNMKEDGIDDNEE